MRNIEEQLNALQKTTMNSDEKRVIRTALVSYIKENPLVVRKSSDGRLLYRTRDNVNKLKTKTNMTIALIIALLLSGGTSFAAENALPGDVLYPVKININEKVQEMAAISSESEAEVQAKLAVRRLEEAEKLVDENRLSTSIAVELEKGFESHAKQSRTEIADVVRKNGLNAAAKVSSSIEATLSAHEDILNDLSKRTRDGGDGEVKGLLLNLGNNIDLFAKTRVNAEASFSGNGPDVKEAVEGARNVAQKKLDRVNEAIESNKVTLDATAQANIREHLQAANQAMLGGSAKINTQEYSAAFSLFKKAAREIDITERYIHMFTELRLNLGNEQHATGTALRQEDPQDSDDVRGSVEIDVEGADGDTELKIKAKQDATLEISDTIDNTVRSRTEAETDLQIKL
ncbi:MAG: DUF5667 domain-containing protein [Candidatus Paceibacterota bacterium]|jgi:hypothetical protein|nr:DUF5667 domain-containing protein [Candidatus Paceibacterota bacterium]